VITVKNKDVKNFAPHKAWFRFILIFAFLLIAAELLLTANQTAHEYLSTILYDLKVVPAVTAIIMAISNALFTLFLLVSLFALVELRSNDYVDDDEHNDRTVTSRLKSRYKDGLIYGALALTIFILMQAAQYYAFEALNVEPLISTKSLGLFLLVIPLIYLLVLGFMEYWLHRALHENAFLWRFHSIHHQIKHLNAANSYSHFGELFIYLFVITTPIILLIDLPQSHIALVTTFYLISNYYMHSDSKAVSFPAPLRHIFADNIYHHYHHSTDVQHWGKNYASFLSIFDRLFGTQYMPEKEEFPVTGIDGYRPIDSVSDYIKRPFIKYILFYT